MDASLLKRLGPLVAAAAVVGLIVLNVARRPDDTPDIDVGELPEGQPLDEDAPEVVLPLPESMQEEAVALLRQEETRIAEALGVRPVDPGEATAEEGAPSGGEAEAEGGAEERGEREDRAAVALAEEPPEEMGTEAEGDCEHPFVPSAVGTWRRYRWVQSGTPNAAVLRLRSEEIRQLRGGERRVLWSLRIEDAETGGELAETDLATRCRPGEDAEEPWFGILERAVGLRLTRLPGRWRWPVSLEEGLRFRGIATFDPRGASVEPPAEYADRDVLRVRRRHVVGAREEITVPAGTFDAWRVDFAENHSFAERGEEGPGRQWIAPAVGLVRLEAENSRGQSHSLALVEQGG